MKLFIDKIHSNNNLEKINLLESKIKSLEDECEKFQKEIKKIKMESGLKNLQDSEKQVSKKLKEMEQDSSLD